MRTLVVFLVAVSLTTTAFAGKKRRKGLTGRSLENLCRARTASFAENVPFQPGKIFDWGEKTILIVSGAFLVGGRVSNFWNWREIDERGNLGEHKSGYGPSYGWRDESVVLRSDLELQIVDGPESAPIFCGVETTAMLPGSGAVALWNSKRIYIENAEYTSGNFISRNWIATILYRDILEDGRLSEKHMGQLPKSDIDQRNFQIVSKVVLRVVPVIEN